MNTQTATNVPFKYNNKMINGHICFKTYASNLNAACVFKMCIGSIAIPNKKKSLNNSHQLSNITLPMDNAKTIAFHQVLLKRRSSTCTPSK